MRYTKCKVCINKSKCIRCMWSGSPVGKGNFFKRDHGRTEEFKELQQEHNKAFWDHCEGKEISNE